VVHSSDLHLCSGYSDDDFGALQDVLAVSRRLSADVVLLAGDVFDHNRVPLAKLDAASRMLADADTPVVILPGNHDCLVPDSVYRRGGLAEPANVHVLGVSVDRAVELADLDLEIWGQAHLDYGDMSPLANGRARTTRWQVATAHGHWFQGEHDRHRSYLIRDEEIAACAADYVALGHWDRAVAAGDGSVPAYYSGSPQFAHTVNVVRLAVDGTVTVSREPLSSDHPRPG